MYSDELKKIKIYDLYGKEILSNETNQQQISIGLDHIKNGIYILQINSLNEAIEYRVIKQ